MFKIREIYFGKLHISFYLNDKFYRWGLFYRDPKKYISFWHCDIVEPKTRKQRIKDFFYYGVYANLKYWKIQITEAMRRWY